MKAPRSAVAPPGWRPTIILWAPAIAWMAIIFVLSAQSSLPSVAYRVPDKLEHACIYAPLGLLLLRAVAGGAWRGVDWGSVALAVALAAAYGLSDELHQTFVPNRHFDVLDLAADAVGAAAGAGFAWAWSIIRRLKALP